ncbi:hypothetical protein N9A28_02605 [Sulfurimonas sp.]|nr:hypothetical protein [Sulfurimonas sp.]
MNKKIIFEEFTFVLHRYPVEVEISNEDCELLENKTISLSDIVEKYSVEYGSDEIIYDDFEFDSYDNLEIVE